LRPIIFLAWAVACTNPSAEPARSVAATPDPFVDLDPRPDVFEAELRAREAWIEVGGELASLLTYGARLPGPEIRVRQGDRVIIHLQNELPADFPTTIHWHGIEGTNTADGTHTTQPPVAPGGSFTYDFRVPRPGVYWFHPHVRGAQGTHSGLYGTLIVDDPDEGRLEEMGVLPKLRQTLVLSDLGLYEGAPIRVESDDDLVLMNGTEGSLLLVNGQIQPTFQVPAGHSIRLQVINTSIAKTWRLVVPGHPLLRIGGQGGLLDAARLEGGPFEGVGPDGSAVMVDPGFLRGEIVLAPGERADLVLRPNGEPGDRIPLRWEDFARGRHGMTIEDGVATMGRAADDGSRPGVDIAAFELTERTDETSIALEEGDAILAAIGRRVEPVDLGPAPLRFVGDDATVLGERMEMIEEAPGRWRHEADFWIDGQAWIHHPAHGGVDLPLAPTARFATLGDRIVWEVRNDTEMVHPFHLHGFSYQPIGFTLHDDEHGRQPASWPVEHVERVDTTAIPAHSSFFFHVDLEDPNGASAAAGRWMMHCHLVQHAEAGMMSELVVGP